MRFLRVKAMGSQHCKMHLLAGMNFDDCQRITSTLVANIRVGCESGLVVWNFCVVSVSRSIDQHVKAIVG